MPVRDSEPGVRQDRQEEEGLCKKDGGLRDKLFPHLMFIKSTRTISPGMKT